jgi:hypothetical protein
MSTEVRTPEERARMQHIAKVIAESMNMPRKELDQAYVDLACAEYDRLHPIQAPVEES